MNINQRLDYYVKSLGRITRYTICTQRTCRFEFSIQHLLVQYWAVIIHTYLKGFEATSLYPYRITENDNHKNKTKVYEQKSERPRLALGPCSIAHNIWCHYTLYKINIRHVHKLTRKINSQMQCLFVNNWHYYSPF